VYCDCDAKIHKYPELFDTIDCDIAFHTWVIRPERTDLLSGTMYFNYNKTVLKFLDEWKEELAKTVQWEQKVLANVVNKWNNNIKIYKLPGTYCKIFDRMKHIKEPPIIEHFQKSRLFRSSGSLAIDAKERKSY